MLTFACFDELLLDGFQVGFRIAQSGLDVLVSHEFADRRERNAVAQFLRCVGVTQTVNSDGFRFGRKKGRFLLPDDLKICLLYTSDAADE